MSKFKKIYHRFRKWGLIGLGLGLLALLLKSSVEAIFEHEIQQWWEYKLKPFLFSPVSVNMQFNFQRWVILLGMISLILLTVGLGVCIYTFIASLQAKQSGVLSTVPKLPEDTGSFELTPTDIVNAIVDTRSGRIPVSFLIDEIIMKAVNAGVIKPQAAAEILEEFGCNLVRRSDGTFS